MILYKELDLGSHFKKNPFSCFHVGKYCPNPPPLRPMQSGPQSACSVIDEDLVFVLAVCLRVITYCHCWLKNIRFWKHIGFEVSSMMLLISIDITTGLSDMFPVNTFKKNYFLFPQLRGSNSMLPFTAESPN